MKRIVYLSTARPALSGEDLEGILQSSRRNNALSGLTGLLMYHEGAFFQVLEGAEAEVAACFERIAQDPRHRQIIPMIQTRITTRAFPGWRMGFARPEALGPQAQETVLSIYDIYSEGGRAAQDAPEVRSLVNSFLKGFRSLSG